MKEVLPDSVYKCNGLDRACKLRSPEYKQNFKLPKIGPQHELLS